jgi:predicted metalloprotease
MRWRGGAGSGNVEDRRGMGGMAVGGGLGAVVIALVAMLFGVDPGALGGGGGAPADQGPAAAPPADDSMATFISRVLKDTEDTWNAEFARRFNRDYEEPSLVLFSGAVQSGCGFAQAAMGPFYCPLDHKVYIDLSFYRDLEQRFGAPGDFAQAYVIAHEVGHHVQTLLGISQQVDQERRGRSQEEGNQLSVMQELQADCFAGVWGFHTPNFDLEPGEVREALDAASAIGDDRLQRQSQGYVVPESFTHGSSEQRMRWFNRGFQGGDPEQCDTFNAPSL